jgi:tryptophan synthase alpha chain
MLQFGLENFLQQCQETGIDGLIIPDFPLEIYLSEYKKRFEIHGIAMIFLIILQTSEERILLNDAKLMRLSTWPAVPV